MINKTIKYIGSTWLPLFYSTNLTDYTADIWMDSGVFTIIRINMEFVFLLRSSVSTEDLIVILLYIIFFSYSIFPKRLERFS